jgi:predicted transposase YdaD
MEEYKRSITDYPDVRSAIRYAEKRAREEGREEGRVEGREEARKEAREKGRVEGREEANRMIAQECALRGIAIEEIAKLTHLSVEQVENIIKNTQ